MPLRGFSSHSLRTSVKKMSIDSRKLGISFAGAATVGTKREDVGLEGLGPWLDQREAEKVAEENRRKRLVDTWQPLESIVKAALERVNAKLAAHSEYKLYLYDPNFFGRHYSGYGTIAKLVGETVVGYDDIPFVVTEDAFYVAGFHHWSEGFALPFDSVTVDGLADTVADAVKSMIEG
jgi:hypothetical protein